MRSKRLNLQRYDTDKIASRYLESYDPILQHLVDREVRLLELGVHEGGSLLLWRDYFPKGTVVGIDVRRPPVNLSGEERIQVFRGSQEDTTFLTEVANETAPDGFDIIIDDASHIGTITKVTFWHLFNNHLKPSGLYVIEDWGTGYWDDWPDGKAFQPASLLHSTTADPKAPWPSHSYGMVGFIKELLDELGAVDLTRRQRTGIPLRASKFEKIVITPFIVFVTKRPRQAYPPSNPAMKRQ
jgi:hypothetical protein